MAVVTPSRDANRLCLQKQISPPKKEVPLLGKGRVAIIGLFALLALLGIRDSFALAVGQAITLPLV